MVMERRHRENTLPGQAETQHLENYGNRFEHEDAADHGEQQLLFATDRDHANQAANRQRAGIAHDHFRRVTIEPEEPEPGADERGTNYRELTSVRVKGDLEV